jgi:hypothetical protein
MKAKMIHFHGVRLDPHNGTSVADLSDMPGWEECEGYLTFLSLLMITSP